MSYSTMINAGTKRGITSSLLHIVAYEVSPKSLLHPLPFFLPFFSYLVSFLVALFSPFVVRFFLPPTDYTLVGAAVSRDSQDTKRWNERERIGTMKREHRARTSVDPPSGIARLICPITLNNPRDNSIAWYPGTVREVARLSANFLQFVNVNSRSPDIGTRITRLTTRN